MKEFIEGVSENIFGLTSITSFNLDYLALSQLESVITQGEDIQIYASHSPIRLGTFEKGPTKRTSPKNDKNDGRFESTKKIYKSLDCYLMKGECIF